MKNHKKYSQADNPELRLQLVEETQLEEVIIAPSRSSVDNAALSHILHKLAQSEIDKLLTTNKTEPEYWN